MQSIMSMLSLSKVMLGCTNYVDHHIKHEDGYVDHHKHEDGIIKLATGNLLSTIIRKL